MDVHDWRANSVTTKWLAWSVTGSSCWQSSVMSIKLWWWWLSTFRYIFNESQKVWKISEKRKRNLCSELRRLVCGLSISSVQHSYSYYPTASVLREGLKVYNEGFWAFTAAAVRPPERNQTTELQPPLQRRQGAPGLFNNDFCCGINGQ